MHVIYNDNTVYFDVDDTLVLTNFGKFDYDDPRLIDIEFHAMIHCRMPHAEHIELLKQFKKEGRLIVVWSQTGAEWVVAVVKKLGLEEFVDLAIAKPLIYVDDLPAADFMEHRQYITFVLPSGSALSD